METPPLMTHLPDLVAVRLCRIQGLPELAQLVRRYEHEYRLCLFRDLAAGDSVDQLALDDQITNRWRRQCCQDDVSGGDRQAHAQHQ